MAQPGHSFVDDVLQRFHAVPYDQRQHQRKWQAAFPCECLVVLAVTALEAVRFNPLSGNFNCTLFLVIYNSHLNRSIVA
jgi:hypothetical protein